MTPTSLVKLGSLPLFKFQISSFSPAFGTVQQHTILTLQIVLLASSSFGWYK